MLKKTNRLQKKWHLQKGKVISSRQFLKISDNKADKKTTYFIIYYDDNKHNECRFGISIPRRMVKLATKRNLYKRQIYSMLISYFKAYDSICKGKRSFHYDFFIIIGSFYLENNFETNKKKLQNLLFFVKNRINLKKSKIKNNNVSYKKNC